MIAITSRRLVPESRNFTEVIDRIAAMGPQMIILREKDLSDKEYINLFNECEKICKNYNVVLAANGRISLLDILGAKVVQTSYNDFIRCNAQIPQGIKKGVSVHSVNEAVTAERLGADYVIAGHIYDTACKSGIPGRGLGFLKQITKAVSIPVYAIGGIETPERQKAVLAAGASDYCLMSSLMKI